MPRAILACRGQQGNHSCITFLFSFVILNSIPSQSLSKTTCLTQVGLGSAQRADTPVVNLLMYYVVVLVKQCCPCNFQRLARSYQEGVGSAQRAAGQTGSVLGKEGKGRLLPL